MPRLTFVVPTRNRRHTALPCIRSILAMPGDFQLVVRDCSDTRVLEQDLRDIADRRLSYAYAAPTSMTDNWNHAFAQCDGDVICYIGDDDGIIPGAIQVIDAIAARGELSIVVSSAPVVYSWPDYPQHSEAGVLGYPPPRDTVTLTEVDGRDVIAATLRGEAAPALPRIYHGFVTRDAMEAVKRQTGAYFSTMNPDWFSYFMLAGTVGRYHVVDCPLTAVGRSGASNTGRAIKDRTGGTHMREYGLATPNWDVLIPPTATLESHLGDGIIKALRYLDDPSLLALYERYYLPEMYARSILRNRRDVLAIATHLWNGALGGRPIAHKLATGARISGEIAGVVAHRGRALFQRQAGVGNHLRQVGDLDTIIAALAAFERGNPLMRRIADGETEVFSR